MITNFVELDTNIYIYLLNHVINCDEESLSMKKLLTVLKNYDFITTICGITRLLFINVEMLLCGIIITLSDDVFANLLRNPTHARNLQFG